MKVLLVLSALIISVICTEHYEQEYREPKPAPYRPKPEHYEPEYRVPKPEPHKPRPEYYVPEYREPKPVTHKPKPEYYEPEYREPMPAPYKPKPEYHDSYDYKPPHCRGNETYETHVPCRSLKCNDKSHLCKREKIPGCYCSKGYLRDDYGTCVLPEDCCDGRYEKYYKCKPCNTSCKQDSSKGCLFCMQRGCYCQKGYLKDEYNKCIPEYKCEKEYEY